VRRPGSQGGWVFKNHPEWLQPKPKGYIPDLSDIADLIWIEKELTKKLSAAQRAALEELQRKALAGQLRKKELASLRKRIGSPKDGNRAFLSALRALRTRGARRKGVPAQVIALIDKAIAVMENDAVVEKAGLGLLIA